MTVYYLIGHIYLLFIHFEGNCCVAMVSVYKLYSPASMGLFLYLSCSSRLHNQLVVLVEGQAVVSPVRALWSVSWRASQGYCLHWDVRTTVETELFTHVPSPAILLPVTPLFCLCQHHHGLHCHPHSLPFVQSQWKLSALLLKSTITAIFITVAARTINISMVSLYWLPKIYRLWSLELVMLP